MILGVLQARLSSTRLPGKVLLPLLGRPMLFRQWERLQRCKKVDRWVLATSTDSSDDSLEAFCREHHLDCFRGDMQDVLDRFYQAALPLKPDHVLRVTGDCPLIDPEVVDQVAAFYLAGRYDYASNTNPPTFPDGLDVEIFRFESLQQARSEAKLASQREHVTPFLHQNPQRFKLGNFKNARDLSGLRWTVDTREDFIFIQQVYERLYAANPEFSTQDVLSLLETVPALKQVNAMHHRNEGYEKSLREDRETRHV